ncbi:MAG: hypothetical protein HC936_06785 [Leptolyngbyaceae cyanobacterium SU_3_3]|nr:hypothetical protein [Leptolyngbyaceae cyanobacterium SU_3_3]
MEIVSVLLKHGSDGTNCFIDEPCHRRRTYYRNRDGPRPAYVLRTASNGHRYNSKKRRQYRQQTGQDPVVLRVAMPETTWAELHLFRERVDAPLHAIRLIEALKKIEY